MVSWYLKCVEFYGELFENNKKDFNEIVSFSYIFCVFRLHSFCVCVFFFFLLCGDLVFAIFVVNFIASFLKMWWSLKGPG